MTIKLRFAGALIALLAQPAEAQNTPEGTPTRIRGTVEKLEGQSLMVKSREGQQLTIALAPNFTVSAVLKKSLADIKPGDYVGAAWTRGTDGKLHALEVAIFPEAMRGTGRGERPWDLTADSLMTNATVAGIASAAQGQVLKLTYKGGELKIIVALDKPIVTFAPGDANLLKPGAAIITTALKKADGSFSASRMTAGRMGSNRRCDMFGPHRPQPERPLCPSTQKTSSISVRRAPRRRSPAITVRKAPARFPRCSKCMVALGPPAIG